MEVLVYSEPRIPFVDLSTVKEVYGWFHRGLSLLLLFSVFAIICGLAKFLYSLGRYIAGRWNDYSEWVAYGMELKGIVEALPTLRERHSSYFGPSDHFELMPRFVMRRANIVSFEPSRRTLASPSR